MGRTDAEADALCGCGVIGAIGLLAVGTWLVAGLGWACIVAGALWSLMVAHEIARLERARRSVDAPKSLPAPQGRARP